MAQSIRTRKIIFTQRASEFTMEEMETNLQSLSNIRYYVFQKEKGEESDYEHYQGYMQFRNVISFSAIKKIFPTMHLEQQKGSNDQAKEYCSKSDTRLEEPREFGIYQKDNERGERQRDFMERIKSGATYNELFESDPSMCLQNYDKIQRLRLIDIYDKFDIYKEKMRDDLKVIYQYGKSGTGKSYSSRTENKGKTVYVINDYEHPFDLYQGEEILVFEEYRSNLPLTYFLSILDIYPCQLSARYNNKFACYNTVYINSNISLFEQYRESDYESRFALERRIGEIRRYKEKGMYVYEKKPGTTLIELDITDGDIPW